MSIVADPSAPPLPLPAQDPFYFGTRWNRCELPDGSTRFEAIPLTLLDHLHPQEGDHFVEGSLHHFLRDFLFDVFHSRVSDNPAALVLSDTGIYWHHDEFTHHSPDIAVIFGIRRPRENWPSFDVVEEGTRPRLITELVTPRYRDNDVVRKFREYHQARVPLYVILDRERDGDPWVIRAYQWTPRGYQVLPLAEDGRLWLADLHLWLAVEGMRVRCFDGETDKELGDYTAVTKRADAAEARANAEKTRADAEKSRADAEKSRADAERMRADEADARVAAEKANAAAAEARLRELEARLSKNG